MSINVKREKNVFRKKQERGFCSIFLKRVSQKFLSQFNIAIYNCDKKATEILNYNTEVKKILKDKFGDIFDLNNTE